MAAWWIDAGLVLAGIALLAVGGEALIRGALAVAGRLGVSPLLSGLVIVGFGTSMPELTVSLDAARFGHADIAIGNVVGSNIGNVLLILGLCALISPLTVSPAALRRDAVVMVGASGLFLLLAIGGFERWDGAILLALLVAYLVWTYRADKAHRGPAAATHQGASELPAVPRSKPWIAGALILGLALLIGGAKLLIEGARGLAEGLGASEALIGLTVVAVGTSMPELTVSVLAAIRRQGDVAIGNVLGSNIFNLLGILGLAVLVRPLEVPARILAVDQWVLLGTAVLALLFLATQRRVARWEGAVLVAAYGAYVAIGFAQM